MNQELENNTQLEEIVTKPALTEQEMIASRDEIRSDLWDRMTLPQLISQQDIIHRRIEAMLSTSLISTPSGQMIYGALQNANDALMELIEHTSVDPIYKQTNGKRY